MFESANGITKHSLSLAQRQSERTVSLAGSPPNGADSREPIHGNPVGNLKLPINFVHRLDASGLHYAYSGSSIDALMRSKPLLAKVLFDFPIYRGSVSGVTLRLILLGQLVSEVEYEFE